MGELFGVNKIHIATSRETMRERENASGAEMGRENLELCVELRATNT